MSAMASQITCLRIVYSTVYSGVDQRKHQSSARQAFVRGIHRWPANSPHKWPVTRKIFPFDDVTMCWIWAGKSSSPSCLMFPYLHHTKIRYVHAYIHTYIFHIRYAQPAGNPILTAISPARLCCQMREANSQSLGLCHHSQQLVSQRVHSQGPGDAIWRQSSGSALVQVMACCLTAPSHYLNQCWLIISKVEWHSSKGKFTTDNSAINH